MFNLLLLTCTLLRGLASLVNVKSTVRSCILEETDEIVTNCKVGGQTKTLIKTATDIHIDKSV